MTGSSNPMLGMVGLWMFLCVVFALAFLLGGIYLLYSLGRAAAGLERMADSAEEWIEHLKRTTPAGAPSGYAGPGTPHSLVAVAATPPLPASAPTGGEVGTPRPFVPGANNPNLGGGA